MSECACKRGKLVRDRLAEQLRARGKRVCRASPEDAVRLLAEKVLEEAQELALNPSLEEAADVLEALIALAEWAGWGWGSVIEERDKKRSKRGGFRGLHVLCLE